MIDILRILSSFFSVFYVDDIRFHGTRLKMEDVEAAWTYSWTYDNKNCQRDRGRWVRGKRRRKSVWVKPWLTNQDRQVYLETYLPKYNLRVKKRMKDEIAKNEHWKVPGTQVSLS